MNLNQAEQILLQLLRNPKLSPKQIESGLHSLVGRLMYDVWDKTDSFDQAHQAIQSVFDLFDSYDAAREVYIGSPRDNQN
jgi:hypothetical protein